MQVALNSNPLIHDVLRVLEIVASIACIYYVFAYWLAPALWQHYEHHPKLEDAPKITYTKNGIPGDPLNVGLYGSAEDIIHAMVGSGWLPADPITFKTSLHITESALLGKPYPTAPVSNLYVFGRIEDLAFEKAVPGNTRQRNHVRFWRSAELGENGKPFWIGAATFDMSVGVSHLTGQITHHIAPDIDAERDALFSDLLSHQQLVSQSQVTGIGNTLLGRNGGGDRYYTDGEMSVGVVIPCGAPPSETVTLRPNPLRVQIKNGVWSALRWLLHKMHL